MGFTLTEIKPYSSSPGLIPGSLLFALRIVIVLLLHYTTLVKRRIADWWAAMPRAPLVLLHEWCSPRTRTRREAGTAPQPPPIPRQLLQIIGRYLDPGDVAAARLVSKEWRGLLSAQVTVVQLPPQLWQYSVPAQLVQLFRLLGVFRHLQEVKLALVAGQPFDSWVLKRVMDTFRAHLPTLQRLELSAVMQPAHWRAILDSMQCLSPQLKVLKLTDICWPPSSTLHLLSQLSALRQLHICSPHFSRLEKTHLETIGQLTQLQELRLCFRTVDGTAHTPLRLDSLSKLVGLTSLEVQYTGLLELASAVVFCGPAALKCLTNLTRMTVSLVPVPCLGCLQQLDQLRHLALHQALPVTGAQCVSLSGCQQLHSLSLSCVQWADVPKLAPLGGLQGLSLQIYQPARGSLPAGAVGQQLLQLKALSNLRRLKLKGQCELSADLLVQLASHWGSLTELDLCCIMPDGTQGLQQFSALRSLKLQPYKWDVWSSEPPVLMYPAQLPTTLTSIEGLDVWCMAEAPPSRSNSSTPGTTNSGSLRHSSSYCNLTGLWSSMSSVGSNLCNLGNPGAGSSSAADTVPVQGEAVLSAAAAAAAAVCGDCVDIAAVDTVRRSVSAPVGTRSSGDAASSLHEEQQQKLLLRTPHLKRLVLRSTSPFDRRLHMPHLSCCTELEYLELHHSQFNQGHLQHIAASCPATLRSLKLVAIDDTARIRASGLTILTQLTALTNLSVHAHERAINKNVRRAISSMSQLRTLTLLTSPDYPTNFARHLGCLTQLTNLMVLRVGLGFGALDALRRLGSHVTKALPHCTYQMLTDGCADQ